MKHYILFFLLITSSIIIAGNKDEKGEKSTNSKIITGKVIDRESKEEIAGAEIIISGKKVYSDFSGNFSVIIPTETIEALSLIHI